MTSIRRYLTRAVMGLVLLGAILSGLAAWLITRHELEEMFDAQLSQFGRIVTGMIDINMDSQDYQALADRLTQPGHAARFYSMEEDDTSGIVMDTHSVNTPQRFREEERLLSLGFWNSDRSPRMLSAEWNDNGPFPPPKETGYRWVTYDSENWRVFSIYDEQHGVWVSTGLREDFQQELVSKILLGNSIPFLLILPLLGFALWWVIRRGLRPIDNLSAEVARRYHQDLTPIEQAPPQELWGLRDSLNAFIERLRMALDRERRFTADAAHELRTPLAGLKIHLDNARASEQDYQSSLDKARQGIERLQRVVDQLLTLARVERSPQRQQDVVDLYPIASQLAGEMWPLASHRQQQLEMSGLSALEVRADPTELGVLLRNLLDNALRYTPDGGTVMLHLDRIQGQPMIQVIDDGPGVPAESLEKITERFHRANQRMTGSGLGLSIVKQLTQRQQATLVIHNREPHGLIVTVTWPPLQPH
ncbi:two-component sensor histidine kinase [Kushneria pakistanensis]|uniref:histidine kinase n=1 Tax=Kushneria pakistanensis TaxID=1508770 RepID=A0ABQ3FCG6_9GAMM|nr:ATP-binding protein [Kushneria pakistanensis]GHC18370.1 two-component sensor histidine kinase [Kushneria pakistanensis]